ncbi:MAG: NAD(+) diphosphatase [Butyrivibrio sp.]|nr:NAD(+) diphosphatase [Butyrivibrio sp.]
MIQDIFPAKLDNHYCADAVPDEDSYIFSFIGDELLYKITDSTKSISYPTLSDFVTLDLSDLVYLFKVDDRKYFLLLAQAYVSSEFSYHKMRELRNDYYLPKKDIFAAFTAYQLSEWYLVTKYCGKCGRINVNDKVERARVCPNCGNKIYPRINPAVIIGICDKETNRILLTKYRTGFAHNALVAGFTEIGETLEGTVERESMEEVGLKVKNIRYYKSQPWAVASDILMGYFCDVDGDKDITMDTGELKYAEWVAPEDIVLQPIEYSLTNEMMKLFKEKGYEGTL